MVKLNYGYVQNVKKKREYKVINETHLFMSNRQISEIVSKSAYQIAKLYTIYTNYLLS